MGSFGYVMVDLFHHSSTKNIKKKPTNTYASEYVSV